MRQLTLNLPFGSVVFIFPLVVLFQCTISELAIYHLRWYARVQDSSVKSHSRRASLDTLTPTSPCFVDFASIKLYLIVLSLLTGVGAPKILRFFICLNYVSANISYSSSHYSKCKHSPQLHTEGILRYEEMLYNPLTENALFDCIAPSSKLLFCRLGNN